MLGFLSHGWLFHAHKFRRVPGGTIPASGSRRGPPPEQVELLCRAADAVCGLGDHAANPAAPPLAVEPPRRRERRAGCRHPTSGAGHYMASLRSVARNIRHTAAS